MTIQFTTVDNQQHTIHVVEAATLGETLTLAYEQIRKHKVTASEKTRILNQVLGQIPDTSTVTEYERLVSDPIATATIIFGMIGATPKGKETGTVMVLGVYLIKKLPAIVKGMTPEERKDLIMLLYKAIGPENLVANMEI